MSLGGQSPVQAAYTAAGQAALNNGLLIIAAAGNSGSTTGAPANSPTIMSVASLVGGADSLCSRISARSKSPAPDETSFFRATADTVWNVKRVIAWPRRMSPAAPRCGRRPPLPCADELWRKLQATALTASLPAARVGAGLVQAP